MGAGAAHIAHAAGLLSDEPLEPSVFINTLTSLSPHDSVVGVIYRFRGKTCRKHESPKFSKV